MPQPPKSTPTPPEAERPRRAGGDERHADTVTLAFGEHARGVYGLLRLSLGTRGLSAAGALFDRGLLVVAEHSATIEVDGATFDWSAAEAGPVRHWIDKPLAAWHASFDLGHAGFDVAFHALHEPAAYELGAIAGYDQICRVDGTVRVAGSAFELRCMGERGHAWGAVDAESLELGRHVSVWREDGEGVLVSGVRAAGAGGQEDDRLAAFLLDPEQPQPLRVHEPRVSTTWDDEGRQRRAGLELWPLEESDYPRRAAGEAVCGTAVDLGHLQLDSAFFTWQMEGHVAAGRYDVLHATT